MNYKDICNFAHLAGVRGLFPSMSEDFLRSIFDQSIQSSLLVKGHHYEDITEKDSQFRSLEQAISAHQYISFEYKTKGAQKPYHSVAPYKLVNHKGIWYLAGLDGAKVKTFSFTKMCHVHLTDSRFKFDPNIEKILHEEDGVWFGNEKIGFILKVSKDVAGYFKRRKLISNQVIEKELGNGDLILSAKVGHFNQVIPIVRYWIPHIQIISPEQAQTRLNKELKIYLSHE